MVHTKPRDLPLLIAWGRAVLDRSAPWQTPQVKSWFHWKQRQSNCDFIWPRLRSMPSSICSWDWNARKHICFPLFL